MARQLFAIKQPVVPVQTDGTALNTDDPIYLSDRDAFCYKGKTYKSDDIPPHTLAYKGDDGGWVQLESSESDDQTAEWVHRYKDGSPRNIGAICSACDIWNGMMTPRCPWCGRVMKNALYSKEGKFLGSTRKLDNQ